MKRMSRDRNRRTAAVLALPIVIFASALLAQAPQEQPQAPQQPPPQQPPANGTAGPPAGLTREKVEATIATIKASSELPEETKTTVLELWNTVATRLELAQKSREQAKSFTEAIESAPKRTAEIRAELEKRANAPAADPEIPAGAADKDLELLLAKERAELANRKSRVESLTSQIQPLQARLTTAREEQAAARRKLEEIDAELKVTPPADEPPALTAARRASLDARRESRLAEIAVLEQEALSQPIRLELLKAERDLADQEVKRLEARIKKIEDAATRIRSAEAEAAKRRAEQARREAIGKHPVITAAANRNKELAEESSELTRTSKRAAPEAQFLEDQAKQLAEQYREMSAQLDELGVAGVDAQLLISQRKRLPQILAEATTVASRTKGKIAETQARRFRATMDLRGLTDIDARIETLIKNGADASLPETERQEISKELRPLLTDRTELLTQLRKNCDGYLETLRRTSESYKSIDETVKKFAELLDEFLLWIPSAAVPGKTTHTRLWEGISKFLSPAAWTETAKSFAGDVANRPVLPTIAALALLALLAFRPRTLRRLASTKSGLRKVETDRFASTVHGLVLTALLALPIPLVLGFVGWRLAGLPEAGTFTKGVGGGLMAAAQTALGIGLFIAFCRPGGVAEAHLRWTSKTLGALRLHLTWIFPVLVVTTFVAVTAELQPEETVRDELSRLAFVLAMIAQAVFIQRVVRPNGGVTEAKIKRHPERWFARTRWLWYPLAVGAPLALAVVAIMGYYYTASELDRRLNGTAWLVVGAIIVNDLAYRWLLIEQRRLAVQRAKEKREAEAQASEQEKQKPGGADGPAAAEGVPGSVETPEVDISAINTQSRQLLKTLLGTSVVVGLWLIWSSVLPALGILNEVQLWDVGTAESPAWITLEHMALVVITLILTVAAAKNLPGVLEIVVLNKLPLDGGLRYAISSICQYVLTAIGLIVVFNALGLKWSSIQWLVAALSVGLGFGLQEIIANFVCGIILLFERPMRVGDIVTVGDVSGTVTRIRIRATTILNWEKKELVVPNKEFVTGRLLNWTLSDTMNRVEIAVGVAYGTDTRRVRQILLEIADQNESVLKDPPPIVLFEAFGGSSLDFKFFTFLKDFSNRLGTMNELRSRIAERFAEEGIEIAFPQLDLHVKEIDSSARALEKTE